jgi:hypothetical protein
MFIISQFLTLLFAAMSTQIVFQRLCNIMNTSPDNLQEEQTIKLSWDDLGEPVLYTDMDNGRIHYV